VRLLGRETKSGVASAITAHYRTFWCFPRVLLAGCEVLIGISKLGSPFTHQWSILGLLPLG
jgi:hypothetical protein